MRDRLAGLVFEARATVNADFGIQIAK